MKVNFMLIDDDIIDLFINQKNIEKLEVNSKIKTFDNAISAIKYFEEFENQSNTENMFVPDYILLDINMARMNGFQFISAFKKLNIARKKHIKIYMLSASNNIKFIDNAKSRRYCNGYISKPLNVDKLNNMLENFQPYLNEYDFQDTDINLDVVA
ncbi:response regulator [Algibacter sp. PT7-4]|uniref:response regulator n=1 Tax=Algibacter ulvanivorans TaxID=3400999 RepID=UPI003AAC8785